MRRGLTDNLSVRSDLTNSLSVKRFIGVVDNKYGNENSSNEEGSHKKIVFEGFSNQIHVIQKVFQKEHTLLGLLKSEKLKME